MIQKTTKRVRRSVLLVLSAVIGIFASLFFPNGGGGAVHSAQADTVVGGDSPCPAGGPGCCCQ